MKIAPICSQTFKGLLIIPESRNCSASSITSPNFEVDTDNIMEISNNTFSTDIKYLDDKNKECHYTFYKDPHSPFDDSRILIAYAAAAANKNVIVKA